MNKGTKVSFRAANGMILTGEIESVYSVSKTGRQLVSVKTPNDRCPHPVYMDELSEEK